MFKVNQSENYLIPLERKRFNDLKLQERSDLQEWLAQTPEALGEDLLVIQKEFEEKSVQGTQKRRHEMRRAFWTSTLEELRVRGIARYANISPSKEHWLASATGVSGCGYNLIFSKKEARVELNLARAEASENKWIFDQLEQKKQEIEDCFGSELHWQRLDEKRRVESLWPNRSMASVMRTGQR